jgi:tryptophan 2,3-dioxygenase
MERKPVHYGEYLALEQILNAQHPESSKPGETPAHDEMLFIIIHQAYELWFKQMLHEIDSVMERMAKPTLNDNTNDMQAVVHRLKRVVTILEVLVQQVDILETMTPMDFLDFRDLLRPASGFQSWQFKIIEAKLGLRFEHRHGQEYYISQLNPREVAWIREVENAPTLLQQVNQWLERMPFLQDTSIWSDVSDTDQHSFWKSYLETYAASLSPAEKGNLESFNQVFFKAGDEMSRSLSPAACRGALFIMLYQGYPALELPFQLLQTLLDIDHQMAAWRARHINMVRRMIGSRVGTGGSTGAGYLQGALEKHYIFREVAQLSSFLIERKKLPTLPEALTRKMGYHF